MGFFSNAHNFIIDGPKGDEGGAQGDPQDVANQALARAHAVMENATRMQLEAAATMSGTSSLQLSRQTPALLASGSSGWEIQRAMAGQDLAVNSGGSTFAGNMGGMSGDQKRDLDAQLAEMRRKLDERRQRKDQRIANGEGRHGRKSNHGHGHSAEGLPTRGRGAITGPPGQAPQMPPTAHPMALPPPTGGLIGPPPAHPHASPPDFNNPEFRQFLALKQTAQMPQMGGPAILPPSSAMPYAPTGLYQPPPANMTFPPPGFDPRIPIQNFSNYGGMPSFVPPPSQPNFVAQNPQDVMRSFTSVSEYTVSVPSSTRPATNTEEVSEEDERDEEARPENDAETSIASTSHRAGSSPDPRADAALSAPPKEKEKRRRSSPFRNFFPSPK